MPRPADPVAIDGVRLGPQAQGWISQIITTIWSTDPLRTAQSIADQAVRAFRKAWAVVDGAWILRPVIQLGTTDADAVITTDPVA